MKKFKYRLEPLLKVKAHIEKERQKEHAAAVHGVQTQQAYLAHLDTTRSNAIERQRQGQAEQASVSPMQLLSYSRYYLKLKRDRIAGTELLKGLEAEAEKRRQRLVEASRERKMHEKLKERQTARFNQTVEILLNKENDEIAVNNFRRRKTVT